MGARSESPAVRRAERGLLARAGMLLCFALLLRVARADTGVLVPLTRQAPDASVLSLAEMQVDVTVDNGDARVRMRQIFTNHTNQTQEGNYLFALPSGTQVSDFAVWDGPVRIPAVILERKRANALYQALKSQAIDPGLLQQGERTEDDARRSSVFSAHIVPIPAYGTKRLEIEYHQRIPIEAGKSYFLLPLKPDAYASQKVAHLVIHYELRSASALKDFAIQGKLLPWKVEQQDEHTVRGSVEAAGVDLAEDFAATWQNSAAAHSLDVIAYRNPQAHSDPAAIDPPASDGGKNTPSPAPGFFEATAQVSSPPQAAIKPAPARTIVVLMDTSLSMQWEKLERSYAAAARLLGGLQPQDRFNLLLFNTRVDAFRPSPVAADAGTVAATMEWLRASHLRGGTDLEKALGAGLAQAAAPNASLVLLTDGGADRGIVQTGKLTAWYGAQWKRIPLEQRPKTEIFAVGDDANLPLLRMLSQNGGMMEQVLSSEAVDFKLAAFVAKIGQSPAEGMQLNVSPASAVNLVYPLDGAVFDGGAAQWVGQYAKPLKKTEFRVSGRLNGANLSATAKADLPAVALEHDQLPRLWAGARVQALLDQIERDGESEAAINEIIRLARLYKFVTPYTSFLAAPRALLRPRVIRPGDPVLRVHTDPSIVSVIALFPFGLEKPLRQLPDEEPAPAPDIVWQTRFLAPPEMQDGSYNVRLILRDRDGHVWREAKSFIIASKPPEVSVHLERTRYRAGDRVALKVNASQSTRTLTARIAGLAPAAVRWNRDAKASTGMLTIPAGLPAGEYQLTVTAEDMAHNIGTAEVRLEVVP